ncbi:MAG: hypothetical protein ACYSP9_04605 [Planctomycetota bacterium]
MEWGNKTHVARNGAKRPSDGTVDFEDPSFVQTSVEFRLPGTYTLMLQAWRW